MALVTTATLKTARFQSTVATGTSPLVVASTTLVTNLNADLLDGEEGSAYHDAANLTGTVASARLSGAYTGITGVGTLTSLTVTGAATMGSTLAVTGDATWNGNHTHQVGTGGSRTVTFRNTAANAGAGRDTAQILFDGDGVSNDWGAIGFLTTQAGALTERGRITSAGVLAWGTTVVTGASVGDIVVTSSRGLVCTTPDGTKRYRISVDNSGTVTSTLL